MVRCKRGSVVYDTTEEETRGEGSRCRAIEEETRNEEIRGEEGNAFVEEVEKEQEAINAEIEDEEQEGEDDGEEVSVEADDDSQPMVPEKLFFGPTEYTKVCKIVTRCAVKPVVEMLEKFPQEVKWFKSHPQFKHVFHMAQEPNHMTQGMWMLLLHTASTEKEGECWFVVNGVPIRYSLREHALLCGFDCHDYPENYPGNIEAMGGLKFVQKQFGRTKHIKIKDVEEKLQSMESSPAKKKMAVLYFLCKVIKAKSKADGPIEEFLLRMVDDLNLCKKFPWGRYTFDDTIKEIKRVMKKYGGCVEPENK